MPFGDVFHGNFVFQLDALSDSNNAIQLDETNVKAYLRKGTALYNQDSKDEALKAFARGLEIDGIVEENLCELS